MQRYSKKLAVLTTLIAGAVGGWWFWADIWPEDLFFPRLQPAATAAPSSVVVGENVHISKPHERIGFNECIIAADPNRPERLFVSSLYLPHSAATGIVGYLSDDGGATWATSLELIPSQAKKERLTDQTAAFGPDGDLYVVHIRSCDVKEDPESSDMEKPASLDWLCLPVGATTWQMPGHIDRFIDRPWLAVDCTTGPNCGRLYCAGNIGAPYFIMSPDGGRTFQFPKAPKCPRGAVYPAQPVVLSDGSTIASFRWFRNEGFTWQHGYLRNFYSNDGWQTLAAAAIAGKWRHPHLTPSSMTTQGPTFPQLAVDQGSPRFVDNLYLVWAQQFDNRRTTEWILFSRSTDRGKTWSAPVNLSEQPDADNVAEDYMAYMPCIAVNKSGVVAVTWYDRRGLAPASGDGSMKGWNVRIRVSMDGGATWAPSIQVTSKPSTGKLTGWHTAGLTADAAGDFHPAWIDDRTGKPQLWTARAAVKRSVSNP